MMTRRRSNFVAPVLALLGVVAAGARGPVSAQAPADLPLFLAIPEAFPDVDGRVVLLREPARTIVLLRASDATPETLHVALRMLRRLDATTPRRAGQGHMAPVTGYVLTTPLADERRAQLDAALTRLKNQPAAHIGNLGLGRSIPFQDLER